MTSNTESATPRPCVLLIEDNAAVRRSVQLLLQGRGFDVRAYAEAARLLADDNIWRASCLVADLRLGEDDGIDLLLSLRRRGWLGQAILISALFSEQVRRSALSGGFAAVLEKPLRPRELVDAVARLVPTPADP